MPKKFTVYWMSVIVMFFSVQGNATCNIGQVECPAYPSYSIGDLSRIYLASGNSSATVQTDETQCIAAGNKMQFDCQYPNPVVVIFSQSGVVKSATLIRGYLPQLTYTSTQTGAPPPATFCTMITDDGGLITVPVGSYKKAYPSDWNSKSCGFQNRTCSLVNGVPTLSGTYKFTSCYTGVPN